MKDKNWVFFINNGASIGFECAEWEQQFAIREEIGVELM